MNDRNGKEIMDRQDIPHAVATIVGVPGLPGEYLIAEISYENCGTQPAAYSLRGHPEIETNPGVSAWHDHQSLRAMEGPNRRSWSMLKDAVRLDRETRIAGKR